MRPYAGQPRRDFPVDRLEEFAASIAEHGQQQPILVRRCIDDPDVDFEIIDGERRWLAAQRAGRKFVTVLVRSVGNGDQQFVAAVIANFCREDMSPLEAARAVARVWDMPQFSGLPTYERQQKVGCAFGRSKTWVSNQLALLRTPEALQAKVEAGEIAATAALQVARIEEPERQEQVLERLARSGLGGQRAGGFIRDVVEQERAPKKDEGRVASNDARQLVELANRTREYADLILDLPPRRIAAAFVARPKASEQAIAAVDRAIATLGQVKAALEQLGKKAS